MSPSAVHASKPVSSCMHTEYFWHAYHPERKLWCRKWRLLLRKTYNPSWILLGDSLHILAILSQPEGIPWNTSSLIRRSSGFFHGHIFYNAWRGQSHKIGETWPGFANPTAFLAMGMAYFCFDSAFFIEEWEFPAIDPCLISSVCWMWERNPEYAIYCFLSSVAFHSTTWWASWRHDSSDNPASRLMYLGYEVWTVWWRHQHIHQCGAQWHNQ